MAESPAESDSELVELVRQKHEQLKNGDYFALLGVARTADPAAIKNAYFVLAKQLHPDVIARQNLEALARPAVEVFKGLSEAYATLTDRRRRVEYEARTADGKAAPTAAEKVQRDAISESRIWYHKGMLLLQRRAHSEAESCFRKAVEYDQKNPRLMDSLGWAVMNNEAKPQGPRLEEARQWFQKALDLSPEDSTGEPSYYMALYFKATGDTQKQRHYLQDCLGANPRHVDALREQRLLSMRARKKNESPLMQGIQKLIDRFQKKA